MLDYAATMEDLETEALKIYEFTCETCSEDATEAVYRGNDLSVYMARTGKMLADAKYHQDIAIHSNTLVCHATYPSMPPAVRNKLISSMCQRENYLVTWIDRLNRTCTHQQQFLITVISKAKAEMAMAGKFSPRSDGGY